MVPEYYTFPNDSVANFTPITFAGQFVREMRKSKGIANIPTVRTAISIPKFLTARYFRKESLDPWDYYEAAVYNTPYEDQEIAKKVAYEMLFPKPKEKKAKKQKMNQSVQITDDMDKITGIDAILSEFADVGLDTLEDLDKVEDLISEQDDAWSFLEELIHSSDLKDQAMMDLFIDLANEYSIIEHNITDRFDALEFIKQLLSDNAGSWSPDVFNPANTLDLGEQLLRQSQTPWEIASAMAVTEHQDLDNYMEDLLDNTFPIDLGYTLKYLNALDKTPSDDWINEAFDRSKNLNEFTELLKGYGQYKRPSDEIIENTGKNDIAKGLDLAEEIFNLFGQDLSREIFEHWKNNNKNPSLEEVLSAPYDDGNNTWEDLLKNAVTQDAQGKNHLELADTAKQLDKYKHDRLSPEMKKIKNKMAKDLADKSMEAITDRESFIPHLEDLIQSGLTPSMKKTMKAGKAHGIDESTIAEIFKNAVELLRSYIASGSVDTDRYDRVVRKIQSVPQDKMEEMMSKAIKSGNSQGMSALGAADLGAAMKAAGGRQMPGGGSAQDELADALTKGIGGGENLLKQWFKHRRNLPASLKEKVKYMMRDALLEIGMEWANKGTGTSEEGMIPIIQTRPYRPGDDLDLLDIQATLDAILASGKKLDQIQADELMVSETSKGKTALGVLIDISGSMSGPQLAMCAIAVVMLLGRLESKEIAVALFESNTHVVKGFHDETELDEVADQLLDLEARGGTRVQRALEWIGEEFISVPDSEVKILYLLSDFMFSEDLNTITKTSEPMISEGVKILAAYHGYLDRNRMNGMIANMDGVEMKITNFNNLPRILIDAISSLS